MNAAIFTEPDNPTVKCAYRVNRANIFVAKYRMGEALTDFAEAWGYDKVETEKRMREAFVTLLVENRGADAEKIYKQAMELKSR